MILVAAMISSAGSEEKSRWVVLCAISRVMRTTVGFCRHFEIQGFQDPFPGDQAGSSLLIFGAQYLK
jgi:hypothetical protein